jgi:hypothetical protein
MRPRGIARLRLKWDVLGRDSGKCALCHLDCSALLSAYAKCSDGAREILANYYKIPPNKQDGTMWLWEMDHIVPVADGGSSDLGNLRTLCYRCHTSVTRTQNMQRKRRQKEYLSQPLGEVVRLAVG